MCSVNAMARSLDVRQQAELTAFVNALADAADYRTTADWARDSGYAYPNLTNLRNAKGAVDGYNLLRLIRAAAARTDLTTEQLALVLARATAADASEASIASRLEDLAAGVKEALELLKQARDERAAQPEAQQPGTSTRRTPTTKKRAAP